MAALLVALGVMAVVLTAAMPVWNTAAQREREAELVFRGEQYARAVVLYQRQFAGAYPPNLDVLVTQKFLRKRYKDPMTPDGEFQLVFVGQGGQAGQAGQAAGPGTQPPAGRGGLTPPQNSQFNQPATAGRPGGPFTPQPGGFVPGAQAGIMGVVSKSAGTSLRLYNGRGKYNEWTFIAQQASTEAGGGAQGGRAGEGGARGAQPGLPNGGRGGATPGGQQRGRGPLVAPGGQRGTTPPITNPFGTPQTPPGRGSGRGF